MMLKERNTIEVLRNYGDNKRIAYAFTYAFLFVVTVAQKHIYDASDLLKQKKPHLYKHEIKKLLKTACNNIYDLQRWVRQYTNEDEDYVLDNIEEFEEKFNKEVFVLYNVMLRQSAPRWFKDDYELATICVRVDLAHLLLEYWQRMSSNVTNDLPYPLNQITNDYDVKTKLCNNAIRNFITHKNVLPNVIVDKLTTEMELQFQGAFRNFVLATTQIFNEMLYGKQDTTEDK